MLTLITGLEAVISHFVGKDEKPEANTQLAGVGLKGSMFLFLS